MAEPTAPKIVRDTQLAQRARERFIWAIKPFGFLGIFLWLLTPSVADKTNLETTALLAFLLGALYGMGFYYQEFKYYLLLRQNAGRNSRNTMPDDYYWGQIAETRSVRKGA